MTSSRNGAARSPDDAATRLAASKSRSATTTLAPSAAELTGDGRSERSGAAGDDGDAALEPVRMDHDFASMRGTQAAVGRDDEVPQQRRRVDVVGIEQPLVPDPSERPDDRRALCLGAGAGDDGPVAHAAAYEAGHVGPHRAVELDEVGIEVPGPGRALRTAGRRASAAREGRARIAHGSRRG